MQGVTPRFILFVSPERALKDVEIRALSRQPVFRGIFLLAWGLRAQNMSGFVLPSRGKERGGRALEASFQQYLARFTFLLKEPQSEYGFWQESFLTAEGPWPHE